MRSTLENNLAYGLRQSGSKYGSVTYKLTGAYVIPVDGPTMHFFDANGANRIVALPSIAEYGGQLFYICNQGLIGDLHVVDDDGVPVASVRPDETGVFMSSQFAWSSYLASKVSTPATQGAIFNIEVVIDSGDSPMTPGPKGDYEVAFDFTIQRVTLLASQVGDIQLDIWRSSYANFPPTNANSITGTSHPTIVDDDQSVDNALLGWSPSVIAGDILRFNVDSVEAIQRVTLSLKCVKVV